jgi:signal transduction histidine kinase
MRGDLDPYRSDDTREIQRLLEAAALAFANSAEYMQRREAEATIRQLYEQLQQTQVATAAAIARELHDEILNVNLRLNVEALQRLLCQVQDPSIQAELELILEGEQAMSQTIRLICEDLHPTGMDDPLGLPGLLRQLMSQIQASWFGQCYLAVEGTACTIAALMQRETLGIVREAMTNAVKHASATEIVVTLRYPQTRDEPVQLTVRDNGQSGQLVVAKPGHLGVQGMYERARTVGGTLQFYQEPDNGTSVVFSFPPERAETIVSALAK